MDKLAGIYDLRVGIAMCRNLATMLFAMAAALLLFPCTTSGEVRWTYSGTTLTEIPPPGSTNTASVYKLTAAGVLSKITHGTTAMLDFRASAMPAEAPAIVAIEDIRQNYSCETVYLPDTLASLKSCAFYYWTNLKHVEFPATADFVIQDLTFEGTAITNAILPVGTKQLGNRAFFGATKLEYVRLPDTLESIGSQAFQGCSSLKLVEPCIPVSVTNLSERAFQKCAMTNGVEIGFATNAVTGEPIMMDMGIYTLWECGGIPYVKFGPSVHSIPLFLNGGCGSVQTLEYGPNVTNILDTVGTASKTSLSNIVFKRTQDFVFPDSVSVFQDCTKVREVTWNGWFDYSANAAANPFHGWRALQCRFIVPGDNVKWVGFCSHPAKLLPWSDVAQADKDTYFERYGAEAREPVGVSIAVVNGLPRTYIVMTDAELAGYPLVVDVPNTNFAAVAISPTVPEGGLYAPDTEVTIAFTAAPGVTFTGWTGTVPAGDETNATLVVTMDGAKSLTPTFTSTFWVYENGELMDGEFILNASGDRSAITAGKCKTMTDDVVLDLTKPILGGGAITAIADNTFDSDHNSPKRVYLPGTLVTIGKRAFCWCSQTLVTPLVPANVTYIGHEAFLWAYYITGDIDIGFATDASGNSIETTLGGKHVFFRCYAVGPDVRIGPGVRNIPESCFAEVGWNYTPPMNLHVGPNVTNLALNAFSKFHANNTVTRPTSIYFECDMPTGSGTAFDPADYKHRYFLNREKCPRWVAFDKDATKVTPWSQLDADTQAAYWASFPQETYGSRHPTGLTTASSVSDGMGLPPNQWIFLANPRGSMLLVR